MKNKIWPVMSLFLDVLLITVFMLLVLFVVWIYKNPEYELTRITETSVVSESNIVSTGELEQIAQDAEGNGISYDAGAVEEVQSAEQLLHAQEDKSQKLYLRNYLSVPFAAVSRQIFEGLSEKVLSTGAGTVKPGQDLNKVGNFSVAAHNLRDWDAGTGFSHFQKFTDLVGQNMYVCDGEYVFTYRIIARESVPREDSMKYTDDDYVNQMYQDAVLKYDIAPELVETKKIWNEDGTYRELEYPKTFRYGHFFSTYTCEAYRNNRTGRYESLKRILVIGILVDKKELRNVDSAVQALFQEAVNTAVANGVDMTPDIPEEGENEPVESVMPVSSSNVAEGAMVSTVVEKAPFDGVKYKDSFERHIYRKLYDGKINYPKRSAYILFGVFIVLGLCDFVLKWKLD